MGVTLVAGVHYMYMREYWVSVGRSPIVYRYIDWSITVPLQMIEFNLILQASNAPIGPAGFWRLWVWPAGLSSSSRSLLGSLLRHLAPPTCQKPSSRPLPWPGQQIGEGSPSTQRDLQHCRFRQQDR